MAALNCFCQSMSSPPAGLRYGPHCPNAVPDPGPGKHRTGYRRRQCSTHRRRPERGKSDHLRTTTRIPGDSPALAHPGPRGRPVGRQPTDPELELCLANSPHRIMRSSLAGELGEQAEPRPCRRCSPGDPAAASGSARSARGDGAPGNALRPRPGRPRLCRPTCERLHAGDRRTASRPALPAARWL